ncbi:MAG: cAMP-binding protein CbpA [Gammaproteobacteria bacterium]|nr:MAG: cAMP-binding protein CbpA [Gammaproteobacteria bacterium]
MYHNLKIPDQCHALWQTCQSLIPGLLKDCTIKSPDLKIKSSHSIDPQSKSIFLIKSGTISETYDGQLIVNYENGDLIGTDGLFQKKTTTYENDFAVIVDEYDGQQFIDEITNDKNKVLNWSQYLSCLNQSFQLLACHFGRQDAAFNPEFRIFKKGDVIIEENTEGDEVFTLLTGSSRVMVNNTEVGEINSDEIFGAIAALTNTKRIASVVATSECETLVIKNNNFRSLLKARPDTVQKLINDMARTIVSCNDRIMDLSK